MTRGRKDQIRMNYDCDNMNHKLPCGDGEKIYDENWN